MAMDPEVTRTGRFQLHEGQVSGEAATRDDQRAGERKNREHGRDADERIIACGRIGGASAGVRKLADGSIPGVVVIVLDRVADIRLTGDRVANIAEEHLAGIPVVITVEPVRITGIGVEFGLRRFLGAEVDAVEITGAVAVGIGRIDGRLRLGRRLTNRFFDRIVGAGQATRIPGIGIAGKAVTIAVQIVGVTRILEQLALCCAWITREINAVQGILRTGGTKPPRTKTPSPKPPRRARLGMNAP